MRGESGGGVSAALLAGGFVHLHGELVFRTRAVKRIDELKL